jgi:pSer/pThr/pTyr-binding forkhead associated (FHA) protein
MLSNSTPFMIDLDAESRERNRGLDQTPQPKRDPLPDQSLDLFRQACGITGPLRLDLEYPIGRAATAKEFAPPFVLIGRDSAVDLNLDDPAVSRRHAYLQVIGGHVFCVDLGSRTGLLWGNHSRRAGWLTPGHALDVGPFALRLPDGSANPVPNWDPLASRRSRHDPLPAVELEILSGGRKGTRGRMNRVLALMGHAPECRARLTARGVSRFHCGLLRTPLGTWVVDLLTAHGTFVNETRVRWAKLADGDELRIGEVRFGVRYRSPSGAAAPDLGTLSHHGTDESRTPAEVERLQTRVSELEQAATEAQTQSEAERRERERTEAEAAEARTRLAELEQRLTEAAQTHTQRESERESLQQALAEAEQDRDTARSEVDQLRSQLAEAERLAAESRDRANAERAALKAARVEIEQLQAWVSELEVARAEARTATESREAQTTARIGELERLLAERQQAHDTATSVSHAERREQEQTVAALRAELQSAQAAAERERQAAGAALNQWETQRTGLQNEITRLTHEHEQTVATLRTESEADCATIAQLQARAEEWERLATDHDHATTEARTQIAKLEQTHAEAARTHAQLETERAKLQQSLTALEHERQSAESARTQWETERASLQNEIERLAREQEQILAARRAESEVKRATLEQLQGRAAEWERAAKEHEHAATEARARLAELEQTHAEAARTHTQREAERTKLRQALTALERDRDTARSEANQLRSRLAELEQAITQTGERAHAERTERDAARTEMEQLQTEEQQAKTRIRELERVIVEHEQTRDTAQNQWEAERADLQSEIARLTREVTALRDSTRLVELVPQPEPLRLADDDRVLGHELRFADLGVTVANARVRVYTSTTAAGRKMTHEPALVVELALKNHDPEQVLTAHGQVRSARLEDQTGHTYRMLRATNELGLENAIDGQIRSGSGRQVRSDAEERDVLVFEPPSPNAGDLVLILDAVKYGGTGSIRVLIPKSAWSAGGE